MKNCNNNAGIRMLAFIMTIVMVLTVLPVFAFATEERENPFTDVHESDWFYEDVLHAYKKNLFHGTSATTFSPNAPMTRAMLVTVLYRMEGEPDISDVQIPFTDVKENTWYTSSVKWAYYKGIVLGTTETNFAPNDNITREQLVTILFRYANYSCYVDSNTEYWDNNSYELFSNYSDADIVAVYARDALAWCYENYIVKGKGNGILDPKGNSTRAEVATVLCKYIDYTISYSAHVHVYQFTEKVPATCTGDGCTVYTCECGAVYRGDYVPALGHDLGEWVTVTEPTETTEGTQVRVCSRCSYQETQVIQPTRPQHIGTPLGGICVLTFSNGTVYILTFVDDRNVTYEYCVHDYRSWGTVYCSIAPNGMLVQYSDIDGNMRTVLLCMPDICSDCHDMHFDLNNDGTTRIWYDGGFV